MKKTACCLLFSSLLVLAFAMMAVAEPAGPVNPVPPVTLVTTNLKYAPPTLAEVMEVRKQGRYLATITMERNDVKPIEIVLEGAEAPLTVANFRKLANAGYYTGLPFTRIETKQDFSIIQGGDSMKDDGTGGTGYWINLEINPLLTHKARAISMARTGDWLYTGASAFFICFNDCQFLDGKYSTFGWMKGNIADVQKVILIGDKMKTVTVAPYDGKEDCQILNTMPYTIWQAPAAAAATTTTTTH
ncbi:MAG: peptidylprolyl isomerase [bacterium]